MVAAPSEIERADARFSVRQYATREVALYLRFKGAVALTAPPSTDWGARIAGAILPEISGKSAFTASLESRLAWQVMS